MLDNLEDLRFPVGRAVIEPNPSAVQRQEWIQVLEKLPGLMRAAVTPLNETQLDTPYRPGGWTLRQVVHHVPDSHMNAYIRFCLALTEDVPTIRPYDQDAWAKLPYSRTAPVDVSLQILESVHMRWTTMLKQLEPLQWKRTFNHPEGGIQTLDHQLQIYAWHSRHHLAHITRTIEGAIASQT